MFNGEYGRPYTELLTRNWLVTRITSPL